MKKPRVLMLGWEFPPVINGGLGIACLGLSKALSKYTRLSIIIPKSSKKFKVRNLELIGLNNLDISKLKELETRDLYDFLTDIEEIETELMPYQSSFRAMDIHEEELTGEETNIFEAEDLYGGDLARRIMEYTEYATRIAAQKNFDVVHCHDWMTFAAGVRIKEMFNKPLVVHVHSTEYDRNGEDSRNWIYHLEKWAMQEADAILPVSNYTGKILSNHYQADTKKITAVHNGVDPVVAIKKHKPFPQKIVLFLGRITRQKGPEYFLNIAERVIREYSRARFVVAGTGDLMRKLILKGASKELGARLHFTGFLRKEQVNHLLGMSDAYCMPSVSEPFGLSALEAAQFGIPCVISKQSGVAEVLSGSIKADFWDVNLMADGISNVLKDTRLKHQLIEEAFHNLKDCTWDKAARKVMNTYKELI